MAEGCTRTPEGSEAFPGTSAGGNAPASPTAVGRCSDAWLESVVLPGPPARLFFIEKQPKLHPESLTDMPQRDGGRIALSQFETANVGSVYPMFVRAQPIQQQFSLNRSELSEFPALARRHKPARCKHSPQIETYRKSL